MRLRAKIHDGCKHLATTLIFLYCLACNENGLEKSPGDLSLRSFMSRSPHIVQSAVFAFSRPDVNADQRRNPVRRIKLLYQTPKI